MKSDNPILQKILNDLQERNKEALEWKNNFAEKIILELNQAERQE